MYRKGIIICIIPFFMLVYTLDRGINMGTENNRQYISDIGKKELLWDTPMGNKIYMLNKGKIVDSGTHKELLENNKEYQKLYNLEMKQNN